MGDGRPGFFKYESVRFKSLMDEYAKLRSNDEFAEWGKKAPGVAAHMSQVAAVSSGIRHDKERLNEEKDQKQKSGIEMGLGQLEAFAKVIGKQLNDLVELMEKLPSGSVKAEYERLIQPWSAKADTPYLRILVGKSGDVKMNGAVTDLDSINKAFVGLAQAEGLVLYSREVSRENEKSPMVEQVLRLVADNHLPIRLCQPDFSDAVDVNGKLRIAT